jgi:hypothetical protein
MGFVKKLAKEGSNGAEEPAALNGASCSLNGAAPYSRGPLGVNTGIYLGDDGQFGCYEIRNSRTQCQRAVKPCKGIV